MMAKYLAMSFAIEKVVSAPRVIRSCLPISTISMSLVGSLSRSTMLPASRAATVPVFIATPTSACASAGASLVPSPHIAGCVGRDARAALSRSHGLVDISENGVHRALADRRAVEVDAAHAALRRE